MRLSRRWLLLGALLLVACRQAPDGGGHNVNTPGSGPGATLAPIPTLFPTATPFPTRGVAATRTIAPSAPTATPIPFEQIVVSVRYQIPAIGLDRLIEGTVSSRLTVTDRVTGRSVERANQAGILLELQSVLQTVELLAVAADCGSCVRLTLDLPLSERAATGWLTDPILLASLENFTAVALGPHFPPETVLGLRRSAAARHPAHTVALLANGDAWVWAATAADIGEPVAVGADSLAVAQRPADLSDTTFAAPCDGVAIETLVFVTAEPEMPIAIVCPELALPPSLLPAYGVLDAIIVGALANFWGPPDVGPDLPVTWSTMLVYARADSVRLWVDQAGHYEATQPGEEGITMITGTLQLSDLYTSATPLLAEADFQPGLGTFTAADVSTSVLGLRGPSGFVETTWRDDAPEGLTAVLTALDELLDERFATPEEGPDSSTTATPTAVGPTPTALPGATATPEATASPEATATP